MPRPKTVYYCNVCNSFWETEEKACDCERSHLIPEEVNDAEYLKDDRKNSYPDSVLVHFKGGKSARYYRKQK